MLEEVVGAEHDGQEEHHQRDRMTSPPPGEVLANGCLGLQCLRLSRLGATLLPKPLYLTLVATVPAAARRAHDPRAYDTLSDVGSRFASWAFHREAVKRSLGRSWRHPEGAARPNPVAPGTEQAGQGGAAPPARSLSAWYRRRPAGRGEGTGDAGTGRAEALEDEGRNRSLYDALS